MTCNQCGAESPDHAEFCWKCGVPLEGYVQGKDQGPKEGSKQRSVGPSYRAIVLVIATILFLGFSVKLGAALLKKGASPGSLLTPASSSLAGCCGTDASAPSPEASSEVPTPPEATSNNVGEATVPGVTQGSECCGG